MFVFINTKVSLVASLVAVMCSLGNYSYDPMMVNQLQLSEEFQNFFHPTADILGLIVAIVSAGTFFGGAFAGTLVDWIGRKRALALGNLIAIISVIIQASAQNIGALIAGRFILGVSFTLSGVAGPSLIAEATPGKYHVTLTNITTLGLPIFGTIMAAGGIGVYKAGTSWAWRGAVIGEGGSSVLALLLFPFLPESPRWLVHNDRHEQARYVINCMHSPEFEDRAAVVEREYQEIVQTLEFERVTKVSGKTSLKALVATASDRRRFLIALLLNIFTQVSGAAIFPYFFSVILRIANVTQPMTVLYLNTGLSLWALISTLFGIWLCARVGAKTALMGGMVLMIICLSLLAILTALGEAGNSNYGIGAIVVIFIFEVAGFGIWLIQMYTYPPQILRHSQRAQGFAISQATGYGFAIMMSYTLPKALEAIHWRFFAINAGWNCVILFLIWWIFVEVKPGSSLEEMDAVFDGAVHFDIKKKDVTEIEVGEAE